MNEAKLESIFAFGDKFLEISMVRPLELIEIGPHGRRSVGVLDQDEVSIGREPRSDALPHITLAHQAVSREHGLLSPIGNHWFYKDLGSTNSSWLNGKKLEPGKWTLLRVGDVLQLADMAVEASEPIRALAGQGKEGWGAEGRATDSKGASSFAGLGVRSLIVFSRGEFLEEYPVPEYGRALVVGGSKADLRLDVDVHELPSLVIERRADSVCAFTIAKEAPVYCNGRELTHAVNLSDRDELALAHYTILYNDAPSRAAAQAVASPRGDALLGGSAETGFGRVSGQVQTSDTPYQVAGDSGTGLWKAPEDLEVPSDSLVGARSARVSDKLPFGRARDEAFDEEADETIALDADEVRSRLSGYDMHPSMRYVSPQHSVFTLDSIEDKVVLGLGVALLLGLVAVVGYWVFS